MNEEVRVLAGIVTYNPDMGRLNENINAVAGQVSGLIVIDNGSENCCFIADLINRHESARLIGNNKNKGIAFALNQIFRYGEDNGFDWVLTLDQDSVVAGDMIDCYVPYCNAASSITSLRQDRYQCIQTEAPTKTYEYVKRCITSGNMVKVSAWREAGGFNQKLFIDMVDVDFCFRLIKAGHHILRINQCKLLHEIGNKEGMVQFLGRMHYTGNYPALRKYYIFRNMVYIIRRYKLKGDYYSFKRLAFLFIAIWMYEKNKFMKSAASICGILDGLFMSISDFEQTNEQGITREK